MLHDELFVITGKLSFGPRDEMMKEIHFFGGRYSHNLTTQTDYLVVGTFKNGSTSKPGKSKKILWAEKYNKTGSHIKFISEIELLNMIWTN